MESQNNKKEDTNHQAIGFCLLIVIFLLGMVAGMWWGKSMIKKEAVEAGYAEYNPISGDWKWKEKED